jgi:hypothetical protein
VDDETLAAIVHAERERFSAAIDELEAKKRRAEVGPVVQVSGPDAEVTEGIERHQGAYLSRAPKNSALNVERRM